MKNRWIITGLLCAAGIAAVWLIFPAGGGSVDAIDRRIFDELKLEVQNAATEGKLNAEAEIMVSARAKRALTKPELFDRVHKLVNGYEDGSANFDHLALSYVKDYFSELTPNEQKILRPLILPPTDKESFFHVSNWRERRYDVKKQMPPAAMIPMLTVPIAHAASVNSFTDDESGYEVLNDGAVSVYYPADELLPDSEGMPASVGGIAQTVLDGALKGYSEFQSLLSVAPSPVKFYIVQDIEGATGLTLSCDLIYIRYTSPDAYATAMHELFHCFQREVGLNNEMGLDAFLENVFGDERDWLIEGGATFAEHIGDPAHNSEYEWYPRYPANPEKSLFDRSYAATLFWFELYDMFGEGRVKEQILTYAADKNNQTQAGMFSEDFHQIALNVSGEEGLYEMGAATRPFDNGDIPLEPHITSRLIEDMSTPVPLSLSLAPLSMNYFDIEMGASDVDYLYFDLGEDINEGGEDIEVSAYMASFASDYQKISLQKNDEQHSYFILCASENKTCEEAGAMVHEGLSRIFLVVSNRSGERAYEGQFTVTAFGPDEYKVFKVLMNDDLTVPVHGKLTMNIDTNDGTLKMNARKFWMAFSNEFYKWDEKEVPESPNVKDIKIHPTRLTKYVNNFCSFRGFIEFDFDIASENAEGGFVEREFKLEKKDQGNFHITPHRFICDIDPKLVATLGVTGPSLVILQVMFSKINTENYGENSFAGQLHRIFKEFMTLGLKDDTEGKVKIRFMNDGNFEFVKIKFSDTLSLYLYREV